MRFEQRESGIIVAYDEAAEELARRDKLRAAGLARTMYLASLPSEVRFFGHAARRRDGIGGSSVYRIDGPGYAAQFGVFYFDCRERFRGTWQACLSSDGEHTGYEGDYENNIIGERAGETWQEAIELLEETVREVYSGLGRLMFLAEPAKPNTMRGAWR